MAVPACPIGITPDVWREHYIQKVHSHVAGLKAEMTASEVDRVLGEADLPAPSTSDLIILAEKSRIQSRPGMGGAVGLSRGGMTRLPFSFVVGR
jgi:hypothetical protein